MRTVDRADWWAFGVAGALSIPIGLSLVLAPAQLDIVAVALGALAAVTFAPLRWIGCGVVFALLTSPAHKVGEFQLSDVALVAAAVTALIRGRSAPLNAAHWAWLVFAGWGVLVTRSTDGLVPFLHTLAPLAGGYLVARLLAPDDLWRFVRWWALVSIATAPLITAQPQLDPEGFPIVREGDTAARWGGLPGSPNELGLMCAALIVIAYASPVRSRWRLAQIAIGFAGLAATRSVSAGVAAVIGVLLIRPRRTGPWLTPLKVGIAAGVAAVIAARPDFLVTLTVHSNQASVTGAIFSSTNPVTGGGWLYSAHTIAEGLFDVYYDTLHNVYLQLLTDTGLVGLLLFLAALAVTWRRLDRLGGALLVTVAVWMNTIGAYPDAAWGLLGLVVAATALHHANSRKPISGA